MTYDLSDFKYKDDDWPVTVKSVEKAVYKYPRRKSVRGAFLSINFDIPTGDIPACENCCYLDTLADCDVGWRSACNNSSSRRRAEWCRLHGSCGIDGVHFATITKWSRFVAPIKRFSKRFGRFMYNAIPEIFFVFSLLTIITLGFITLTVLLETTQTIQPTDNVGEYNVI